MRSRKSKLLLCAALASAFALGAGLSLLYVLAHPVEVKSICAFMLPRSFAIPAET